jgi:hypothetical protein
MLRDPDPTIRRAVMQALESDPASISPLSMRRLIATRNWHPPDERSRVDGIVRAARAKGIECASWPSGRVDAIMSSGIDGSGAQTILIVSPAGRRKCLSSILFKHGLRDAWTGEPQTERELAKMFSELAADVTVTAVSRTYLDRIVCHGIQLRLDGGECPPAGLLQLAEILGAANWQPERLDWREFLATLLAEVPPARLQPPAVAATLRDSDTWAALPGLADSWFEDDQGVARIVRKSSRAALEKQADNLLRTVIQGRRDKWAELFAWTALWLREGGDDKPWQEFSVLADAIAKGHDLREIPVMQLIATHTALVMADAA